MHVHQFVVNEPHDTVYAVGHPRLVTFGEMKAAKPKPKKKPEDKKPGEKKRRPEGWPRAAAAGWLPGRTQRVWRTLQLTTSPVVADCSAARQASTAARDSSGVITSGFSRAPLDAGGEVGPFVDECPRSRPKWVGQ
ncbi:MAG: hypothetical protein CM1200mP2_08770 [Planctomycetaceae bacterium]|nr:MAG: hypothetical protein CM1200mP2_08770 [Planctomycetaceae bacterium]